MKSRVEMTGRHARPPLARGRLLAAALGLLCCPWDGLAQTDPPSDQIVSNSPQSGRVTIEKIVQAWGTRQQRARSFRFQWIETRTDMKGSVSGIALDAPLEPSQDTTFESKLLLVVDGRKSSFTYDGKMWGPGVDNLTPRKYTSVYDGTESSEFKAAVSKEQFPRGALFGSRPNTQLKTVHCSPPVWFYRPLDIGMGGFDQERLVLTGEAGTIAGQDCIVLAERSGGFDDIYGWRLWLDPSEGFAIRRAVRMRQGRVAWQFDVAYGEMNDESIPTRWTLVRMGNNRIESQLECRVVDFALNMTVPAAIFKIEFPPGTRVADLRRGTEQEYIVREDGPPRAILPADRGASYEQLVESEPGMAHAQPAPSEKRYAVWTAVGGGLLLLAACFMWWKASH